MTGGSVQAPMFGKTAIRSLLFIAVAFFPFIARAGFTETLPQGAFMLEEAFTYSWIERRWNNDGESVPIIDPMERYEPGGGKQGVIRPNPKAEYFILINKLQYGILDDLSLGLGIPVVLLTKVDPRLGWESGDYMRQLGRPYSEDDFWDWAQSLGQSKPEKWEGNKGVLSDIVIGARFRWTHRIEAFRESGVSSALSIFGVIPTGESADPEELVSLGTTMWDLHTQGDIAFHLAFDKDFEKELDGRLKLGVDVFYEVFFTRELKTPEGEKHPLLLNYKPYVGKTYEVNPGDFSGFAIQIDGVPFKGPAWGTWLTKGDAEKAKKLPPILSLALRYTFVHLQQTDWKSEFPLWDWEREKDWRPGYKNFLEMTSTFSFLRLGAPLQIYFSYRNLTWIPGKNCRAPQVVTTGIQVPMKFW